MSNTKVGIRVVKVYENVVSIELNNGLHIDIDATEDFQAIHYGLNDACDKGFISFADLMKEE